MRKSASGKLVAVRAYRLAHVDRLHEAALESIPELSQYETWCHPGYTRDEAAEPRRAAADARALADSKAARIG